METKSRPILFNDEMVRAILAGAKTQTRRVMKPQPILVGTDNRDDLWWVWNKTGKWIVKPTCPEVGAVWNATHKPEDTGAAGLYNDCPHGQPGDMLWMRCNYTVQYNESRNECQWRSEGLWVTTHGRPLRKDGKPMTLGTKPSMHMPYWLSVEQWPLLRIIDVRVERLQDITEDDATAEGVDVIPSATAALSHRTAFAGLWNRTMLARKDPGGLSWDDNPWVWVIQFKRLTDG